MGVDYKPSDIALRGLLIAGHSWECDQEVPRRSSGGRLLFVVATSAYK